MPVCEFDAREGGAYRYEWLRDETGERMGMGGTLREFSPIERMVANEKFDEPWYPGECVNTSEFAESSDGAQTMLTVTSRFESEEALKTAGETGMLDGMEVTYDRLASFVGGLVADRESGALDLTYDIAEVAEQRVGRKRGQLKDAGALWGEVMGIAMKEGLLGQPGVFTASILPAGAEQGGMPEMQYDCSIVIPEGTPIPSGLTEDRIPGGRYARATYRGPFDSLAEAWGLFTGPGLASLGVTVASGPAFEIYRSPGSDGRDGAEVEPPTTELHVPIE